MLASSWQEFDLLSSVGTWSNLISGLFSEESARKAQDTKLNLSLFVSYTVSYIVIRPKKAETAVSGLQHVGFLLFTVYLRDITR